MEPGYLVFVLDRNLMAQPFDARRLGTTGQAVPIAERVLYNPNRWTGEYSLVRGRASRVPERVGRCQKPAHLVRC